VFKYVFAELTRQFNPSDAGMKSTPRTIAGPFTLQDLGGGAWLLTGAAPAAVEIFLRFAQPPPEQFANAMTAEALGLTWRHDGADLKLSGSFGAARFEVRTAIVHEAKPQLYANLPLAEFDPPARRFWTRIFRVMRFPGGRHVLRFLARPRR
jgi:hypothetical protein